MTLGPIIWSSFLSSSYLSSQSDIDFFLFFFHWTWIVPLSSSVAERDRLCLRRVCIEWPREMFVCQEFWGSLSVWVLEGVLGCLLPVDFLIAMEILNLCLSGVWLFFQGRHTGTRMSAHAQSSETWDGMQEALLHLSWWWPLVKRTSRDCMYGKALWWGPSSELIVCFLSHYYDRVFTEKARLRLHSTLLLVPQHKQPHQPGLLLLMKNTFSRSLFLPPSLPPSLMSYL